jgi:hypothetical protein
MKREQPALRYPSANARVMHADCSEGGQGYDAVPGVSQNQRAQVIRASKFGFLSHIERKANFDPFSPPSLQTPAATAA